jgi:LysR family cyn operon transcriptional activator
LKELAGLTGQQLFERQGRRALPTQFATELVQRMAPVLEQLEQTLEQALAQPNGSAHDVAGRLRVGATQTYLRALVLPAATRLLQAHPRLQFDLRQQPAQRLLADLLDGEIDIAVLPKPHGQQRLVQVHLLRERLAVIGCAAGMQGLPLRPSLKSLQARPVALLNHQFLMREIIEKQLRLDKQRLDIRLELSSMDDVIGAARCGHLLGIGSALGLQVADLQFRFLQGKHLVRSASACLRSGHVASKALQAFQGALLQQAGRAMRELDDAKGADRRSTRKSV